MYVENYRLLTKLKQKSDQSQISVNYDNKNYYQAERW